MIKNVLSIFLCIFSFSLQARDLAEDVAVRYGSIAKYEDEGTLVRITRAGGKSSRKEVTFNTKYDENGYFRFYWRESSNRYFEFNGDLDERLTEGMNSARPLSEYYFERNDNVGYSNYRGRRKVIEDFCLSYAGATGISHGVAALVPRYLLASECYDSPHLMLPKAKFKGVVKGRKIVEIIYQYGGSSKLHFGESRGLLEKYEHIKKVGDQEIETTINIVVKSVTFDSNKLL